MSETPLYFAAIVGNHRRHAWLVDYLAQDPLLELRAVVVERQPPPAAAADPLVRDHFARRAEAEARYFAAAPEDFGVPTLAVDSGASNDPAVADWLRPHGAEWLVLFGCSIIREPVLAGFPGRAVNIHLGLSPYYKGHATNLWPLVNGEPECVGATIHLATPEVDAGPILRQARPEPAPADDSHDVGCKAIGAGAEALRRGLLEYAAGAREPVPQAGGGRIYRRADFTPAALAELRRRLEAGMLPAYLGDRERRDAQFPIVA